MYITTYWHVKMCDLENVYIALKSQEIKDLKKVASFSSFTRKARSLPTLHQRNCFTRISSPAVHCAHRCTREGEVGGGGGGDQMWCGEHFRPRGSGQRGGRREGWPCNYILLDGHFPPTLMWGEGSGEWSHYLEHTKYRFRYTTEYLHLFI